MYLSDLNADNLSRELINKILFQDIIDDGKFCDCIFVPATRSGNKYRTPAAVEQYFLDMRRCHLTFKKYAPTWIDYSFCPVIDKTTRPDNWWNYENGSVRVNKELRGLIHYAKIGDIMDFKIE